MKVVNLKCFQLTSCCCWFKFELNDFNLQVVAVGNDVAAEVAVAAVVGDWKGFREGFPAKGGFVTFFLVENETLWPYCDNLI